MHEISIVLEIIDLISARVSCVEHPKVRRVMLEIGNHAAVLPDAIRFSFDLCSRNTVLEGALLEILETNGQELRIIELEVESCVDPADVQPTPPA